MMERGNHKAAITYDDELLHMMINEVMKGFTLPLSLGGHRTKSK
jgi:hypothetical protein